MRNAALALAALLAAAPTLAAQAAQPVPLTLAQAVALAADTAPAVRLAELRVSEARARVRQARGALLPTVAGSAGTLDRTFNRHSLGLDIPTVPGQEPFPDRIGPFDNVDARLSLRQTVFDAAAWTRTRAARQAVDAGAAERDGAAEGSAYRAAAAYLRAARAQALRSAREQDVALADSLVALARSQEEAGVSTAIDVTRARAQQVSAAGALRVAANQAEQAQIELARALSVDPSSRFDLADGLTGETAESAGEGDGEDAAVAHALEARPELRAERVRAQVAETQARAIRAERLPRVDVVADWGVNGETWSSAFPTRQIGVQVSVPIIDGMRREARLAEQEDAARASAVREADLRAQVAAEVQAARLDIASGREQQAIAAERLRLAEEELSQARERFENGIAGNIEVINAQSALVRARDGVIDARYATAAARAALARATGAAQTLR